MLALRLAFLLAVSLSITSAASVQKREADCENPSASPCTVDGETHEDGSTFSAYGDCFMFQCNDGQATMIQEGCQDADGQCRDVDESWPSSAIPCFTYKCTKTTVNNTSSYKSDAVTKGCQNLDGVCVAEGGTWESNSNSYCGTYTCQIGLSGTGYKVSTPVSNLRCKDQNGVCRAINDSWNVGCHIYTCTSTVVDGNQQLKIVPTYRCQDQNGVCRAVDDTWKIGCHSYTCTKTVNNGVVTMSRTPTYRCTDQNSVCRDVGESWNIGCSTYTCTSTTNENGQISLSYPKTGIKCVDANGVCRNQGDTFPLKIGGTLYNSCHCTISGQSISYSCSG